jgi:hypothetical protein
VYRPIAENARPNLQVCEGSAVTRKESSAPRTESGHALGESDDCLRLDRFFRQGAVGFRPGPQAAYRDTAQGALVRIVVERQAAIVEATNESGPDQPQDCIAAAKSDDPAAKSTLQ